jgi:hypothetical protein
LGQPSQSPFFNKTLKTEPQTQLDDAATARTDDLAGIYIGCAQRADHWVRIVPIRVIQEIEAGRIELPVLLNSGRSAMGVPAASEAVPLSDQPSMT